MWCEALQSIIALASLATHLSAHVLDSSQNVVLEARQQPGVIATDQFLRRAYHQAYVVDDYLYVDGGQFSYINNGTPVYEYATATLSLDLSKDWKNDTVVFSTTPKSGPPNLNDGAMWYHESEKVIYADFVGSSASFSTGVKPGPLSLWSFKPDGTGSGVWSPVISAGASALQTLNRPTVPLSASGKDTALVLGGRDDSGNFLPGLIQFDMNKRIFTNISSEDIGKIATRGAMHYVPVFGTEGIFIALGGTYRPGAGMPDFGNLPIFDPMAQKWYNQNTTGNKPASRVNTCVAGIASTNQTYEIFVYSGFGGNLGTQAVPFDTINILTLPAFHWINVPYNPANPIHGHTCHSVGGSQILVVGGSDANPKVVDGAYDKIAKSVMGSPDPNKQGLSVFNMSSLSWQDHYSASPPAYGQSDPIKQYYAQAGGSYVSSLNPDVAILMDSTHFEDVPTPRPSSSSSTSSNPPSHTPTGAIAGGVIGGFVAIALIVGLIWFLLRRRKRRAQAQDCTTATTTEDMYKRGHSRPEEGQEGVYKDGNLIAEVHHDSRATAEADGRGVSEAHRHQTAITAELP